MNYRTIFFSITLTLHLTSGNFLNLSAQSYCDPSLAKLATGPLGYKERGDRCEGIYIKEVGSSALQIGSFTKYFGQLDTKTGKAILISWDNPPSNSGVHIRAQGLRRKLYYQMNTRRPAVSTSYSWSTSILASLNISKSDIGITGTVSNLTGYPNKEIYIPLRITQDGTAAQKGFYNFVLFPGVELSEVFISIAPVVTGGRPGRFIKDGEKLGYGYYPAERSIDIPISGLNEPGIYLLEIGASLKNGGTSTLEIWFYHSNG